MSDSEKATLSPTTSDPPRATLDPPRVGTSVPSSSLVRVTSIVFNGRNFASWSRSIHLFLGAASKAHWLLGPVPKPDQTDPKFAQWNVDNCTILGWLFNSMEDRIYQMFMYHDTVYSLWTALSQMYAHMRNDARIFELYREISHASQDSLSLSVADYFGYLQTRWEELAQYKPLSDFPADAAAIVQQRLNRQHTYHFLMGLKSEFEPFRAQILNTSPMPSLHEVFATIDGEERRRRLVTPISPPVSSPAPTQDQMAFAASSARSSSDRISSSRPFLHTL